MSIKKLFLKVTCTKTTTFNRISITIKGETLDKKITLTVKSNVAYSLEVKNTSQFTVSSDKYTWTKNPSNDDTITFSYLFKDKYQNILTDDIRELNQYTITSETFSSNKQYYDISKPDNLRYFNDCPEEIHYYIISSIQNGKNMISNLNKK